MSNQLRSGAQYQGMNNADCRYNKTQKMFTLRSLSAVPSKSSPRNHTHPLPIRKTRQKAVNSDSRRILSIDKLYVKEILKSHPQSPSLKALLSFFQSYHFNTCLVFSESGCKIGKSVSESSEYTLGCLPQTSRSEQDPPENFILFTCRMQGVI